MAFLVFEGIDGSGKSTLIHGFQEYLSQRGTQSLLTNEPGGTPLAEAIRKLVLHDIDGEVATPLTEILLYEASRAQHVASVIQPALQDNKWVLCDRFTASTLAFQCGGRGIDRALADNLNHIATGGLKPDLMVLLDLSVEESLGRRQKRESSNEKETDRFEQEKLEFHEMVRQYFLKLAKEDPGAWLVLDASLEPKALLEQLIQKLKEHGCLS